MARVIKRYENRKLYDPAASSYVSLEDLARLIREGEEVKVVDNATGEDITAQTLTRIVMEEGRQGRSALPAEMLHEIVRWGGKVVASGKEQVGKGLDRLVQASVERLGLARTAPEELAALRARLEQLEARLEELARKPAESEENSNEP
jgi:polyhydroxyalkanoate synthesis repressor PhaR